MGDDVLTFEELRRVQSQENSSDTLTDLEEGFFDRARNYLEVKKEGADPLNNQEYRNARNILQDVLDMRQKKITKLAFLSVKSGVDVNNLLPHEEELFRELEESIGSYRHDIRERVFEVGVEEDAVEREAEELPGEDTGEEEAVEETEEPSPAEEEMTETDVGEETEEDGEEVEDEEVKSGGEGGEEGEETEEEEQGGGSGPELSGFPEDEEDEEELEGQMEEDKEEIKEGQMEGGEEGDEGKTEEEAEKGDEEEEDEEGEEEGSGEGKILVEAKEDISEFMGTDLEPYGPFEEGERAEVPEQNADVLEEQGKAERV